MQLAEKDCNETDANRLLFIPSFPYVSSCIDGADVKFIYNSFIALKKHFSVG